MATNDVSIHAIAGPCYLHHPVGRHSTQPGGGLLGALLDGLADPSPHPTNI